MDSHQSSEGLCGICFKIRAAGELPGHAAAAQQEDHEEAEGGAQRPVQTSGQQRVRYHRLCHGHPRPKPEFAGVLSLRLLQYRLQPV